MNASDQKVIGEAFSECGSSCAVFLSNHQEVNASSLNRVLQHIQKEKVASWGILSAYRGGKSEKENKSRNSSLASNIRSLGYGYISIKGIGQEEDGTESIEYSFFVPSINLKQIKKLSDKYDQYAFVYSGPETKDKIKLVRKDGIDDIGSFHPMKIAKYLSKVKGKPFVFAKVLPTSWMEGFAEEVAKRK